MLDRYSGSVSIIYQYYSDVTEIRKSDTRQLLLDAAASLISASPGQDVPLRAICDQVGVKLPTLYHFFGSKEGLLNAVIEHGFAEYVALKKSAESTGDPIEDLRRGWDTHVRFGLDNPGFYALMYGQVAPHRRPAAAAGPAAALLDLCSIAKAHGRLVVSAEEAAEHVLAANVGVTLFLITAETPDPDLAGRVRDATIASITGQVVEDTTTETASTAAGRLLHHLVDAEARIGAAETALLRQWLKTLATPQQPLS